MRVAQNIRLAVAAAIALGGSACVVKPVARTVNDIARDLCAVYFSERQGISFEDAARGACKTREVLDPFIREVLKAQAAAGAAAAPQPINDGADAGSSDGAPINE